MNSTATAPYDTVMRRIDQIDATTITVRDKAHDIGTARFTPVNNCLHGHCDSCMTAGDTDCPFQDLAVYCPVELPVSFTVTCLSPAGSASLLFT